MAYYGEPSWNAPARQASWEQQQQAPPSRSGANSAGAHEDIMAFHSQIDEVDRAIDNLVKSGKFPFGMPGRRDSMPVMGAAPRSGYVEYDARMGGSPRHHSVSDFDGMRPVGNVQGFYQNQRFGPRGETDQMMQAKRRMAAQRERELRNYHQEQQYNRSVLADMSSGGSGAKSDRSISPNAMNEDERRELIARQHRALYGDSSSLYSSDPNSRPISQDARVSTTLGGRGASPLAFDPFGMQSGGPGDNSAVQMPSRDTAPGAGKDASGAPGANRSRANSTSSPASNPTTSFTLFENAQQSSRTSNSSPTSGSPPRQGSKPTASGAGVAPIGTRPTAQNSGPNQSLNKRSTTPLPSPLSYGFSASEQNNSAANDRSTSAASNPSSGVADKGVGLGWGGNSGVWGNNNKLGVQASVWG
ncbi:hypothetical protein NA57DRAFT_54494 [Rhizodiscina lignyota]|uniref:Uncharacterized protein n=1 Tax=Rhizodiscina lignyota TaxID=1504668 RepID=A0A9P4MC77_9PEZI|nr:hypothetical protein NA57DRAFT_54494 [Rhizodiscina lignyota]